MDTSLQANRFTTSSNFSQGGNGKYKPLRNRNTSSNPAKSEFDPFNPVYNRMAFKSSRDPLFVAFDYIEQQNPLKLTSDIIKENVTKSISTIGTKIINLFN